jgi:cell division septation protein DedD
MKQLLYLLVIVNLVYFSWHMSQGVSDDDAVHELPPLPPDTRRLMTLQELQDRQKNQAPGEGATTQPSSRAGSPTGSESLAAIEALTEEQPPAAGVPLSCYSVGPFMTQAELNVAAARIEKLELESTQHREEAQEKIGYWIYLPAMPRDKALGYKAKLDKHKDKEYFIGKDNVLSLGAFRQKSRADRRLKDLRKIGIKAVLEPRYKTHDVFWLDLVDGVTAADRNRLFSELPEASIKQQACR